MQISKCFVGRRALSAVFFLGLTGACQTREFHVEPEPEGSVQSLFGASNVLTPEAMQAWTFYKAEAGGDLQEGCEPTHLRAANPAQAKGVVVLYHGFTACPQQYFDLGKRLASQGYEVFLPLVPGHGRKQATQGVDHSFDLIPGSASGYRATIDRINGLVERTKGEKIIGGLSVGGAMALTAVQLNPSLYDRQLLFAPLLKFSNTFLSTFAGVAGGDVKILIGGQDISENVVGFGEACSVEEKQRGRAGYCNFKVRHVSGLQDFGSAIVSRRDQMIKEGKKIRTVAQFVLAENDIAVSNPEIFANIKALAAIQKVTACVVRKPATHSMISPFDKPFNKPWLTGLTQKTEAFVNKGTPFAFDKVGPTSVEGPPYCTL